MHSGAPLSTRKQYVSRKGAHYIGMLEKVGARAPSFSLTRCYIFDNKVRLMNIEPFSYIEVQMHYFVAFT